MATLSDDQKLAAVLELMQDRDSVAGICTRYQISSTYLYKLRDRALAAVAESVKNKRERPVSEEERLKKELDHAKQFIGDQAIVIQAFKKKLGLTST